uniref:Claudin n=1 Tax=Gopherus evgoodei TaxID=1825980 RepID=A0A8C4YKL3_9SAUR
MSAALEITGFLLSLCGWLIVEATLPNSYWKISTIHGNVITTSRLFENLWKSCAEDSTGVSNCRKFDSMLALPGTSLFLCNIFYIIKEFVGKK